MVAADGDIVIDGRIRARLLGLRLLDLDAHVVVGPARTRPTPAQEPPPRAVPRETARRARAAVPPAAPSRAQPLGGAAGNGLPTPLGRAVRLLGEGSSALDDARRIRWNAIVEVPNNWDAMTRPTPER